MRSYAACTLVLTLHERLHRYRRWVDYHTSLENDRVVRKKKMTVARSILYERTEGYSGRAITHHQHLFLLI
jgi:hypothetical protein